MFSSHSLSNPRICLFVARIHSLESELLSSQRQTDHLHDEFSEEMSVMKRKTRDQTEKDKDGLQSHIITISKELELVKAEVGSHISPSMS